MSSTSLDKRNLKSLLNPKNLNLLRSIGGLYGLLKGLQMDHRTSLSSDEVILQSNIMDQDHIEFGKPSTPDQGSDAKEDNSKSTSSLKIASEISKEGTQFYQRICVFGRNVLLMTIAAAISLGLGLYEDFGTKKKVVDGVVQPKIQ
ncbi:8206_t:CDS:2 [Acaulospora morrowiae]|uniref:8206_t:CDS:1 n=1 Tax=Acaulospora morrowiae TaxID=94023 RepID=A0A9N9N619_9GLOM|nr:8206_t:CDS:2 [Acaulospora morrowiae]